MNVSPALNFTNNSDSEEENDIDSNSMFGRLFGNKSSKKDNENRNMATNDGFKIHIQTQFGGSITVYGLNEESTMMDIQKKLEVKHGSAMSKMGIYYGPPQGIDYSMWFESYGRYGASKNSKLKDLGITPNSTVVWNTVYSKYKAELSDEISDKIKDDYYDSEEKTFTKSPFSYQKVVSLNKILGKNEEELKVLGKLLSTRGWCIIEYPKQVKEIIDKACRNVLNAIEKKCAVSDDEKKTESDSWEQLLDAYGYINFKDYKQVIRVLTGDLLHKFKEKYPNVIADDLMSVSRAMDALTLDILKVIGVSEHLFGCDSMKEFEKLCQEKECNITILSGYNSSKDSDLKTSLLDFVYYENIEEKRNSSEYPMIKDGNENVGPHTDPGLFSLSFLSTAPGLQLYDISHDCWREIENEWGIFWCGEAAAKISDGKILSGIHRVKFHGNNPRFTAWHECSVDSQLTKAVLE